MNIDITKRDYRTLLDMMEAATWLILAHHVDIPKAKEKYAKLEQKIFSFAQDFGFDDLIEYVKEFDKYYPTKKFEDVGLVMDYVHDYNDETFWEDLIDRLAERDLIREIGEKNFQALDPEDRFYRMGILSERYAIEVEAHGVERLEVALPARAAPKKQAKKTAKKTAKSR